MALTALTACSDDAEKGRAPGGATFTGPAKVPSPPTVAISVNASLDAAGATQLVSNVTIVDAVTYLATATFTGLLAGRYTSGKATLTFAQFEDLSDGARYALSGGQFEAAVNYPDSSPVAKVIFPAGAGESFGTLVLNEEGSPP